MEFYNGHFVGMHFFWWVFWIFLLIPFFSMATPVRRKTARLYLDNPFAILRRRYAAGEITTEEYEDRKSRIERDSQDPSVQSLAAMPEVER